MSVRVLAFFDTRYQTSPELVRLFGAPDPWTPLRQTRPVSRQHGPLNWPSSLGCYDLANPEHAAAVVGMAVQAGLDGFVVDLHPFEGRYVTGAEPLSPLCQPDLFGLAFRWRIGKDAFWKSPADDVTRQDRAAGLVAALSIGGPVQADGRIMLIVERPEELAEPVQTLAALRGAAAKAGLPGLYIIASRAADTGVGAQGFDAAVDPSPGDWASCQPKNKPSGLDILEIEAGLRDSVELTDKFYHYAMFAVSRMIRRETRGKVFPRVFPAYQNWASHLDGGATLLVNRDGTGSVDRYIYGLFIENAISFVQENFAPEERLVFVESWNYWLDGSQIEPSTLDGDLVYNATRSAIDKGRYMVRTRGEPPSRRLDSSVHEMISQICDAAAAAQAAQKP